MAITAGDLKAMRGRGPRTILRTFRAVRPMMRLLSPVGRADPYPTYRKLRSLGPVVYLPPFTWVTGRYAEVEAILRDQRFSSVLANRSLSPRREDFERRQREFREQHPVAIVRDWMLFRDGDDHARLRSLVGKVFTRRMVEGLRPRVHRLVDELLRPVTSEGRMDLIADLAYPLPVTVICDLVGIPVADRPRFREWGKLMARFLDPAMSAEESTEIVAAGDEAATRFTAYLSDLIACRRADPDEDLLSALIAARDEDDRLSDQELVATCMLLLVAGHETTMNLIGNGVLALLRHPDQLALLREDPSLVPGAIEELLRYDSPVQGAIRVALTDVEVAGTVIPKGEDAIVAIGSANHDPERFTDPDTLDVTREDTRHLAFSAGPHFCLGAPLARLEAQVVLTELVDRFPTLRLATETPVWRDTFTLRGLDALPVAFGA